MLMLIMLMLFCLSVYKNIEVATGLSASHRSHDASHLASNPLNQKYPPTININPISISVI